MAITDISQKILIDARHAYPYVCVCIINFSYVFI